MSTERKVCDETLLDELGFGILNRIYYNKPVPPVPLQLECLDDELINYILVKHIVSKLMNPKPRPLKVKEEFKKQYPVTNWAQIERFSSHHGQVVTLDTCFPRNFECFLGFSAVRINQDFSDSANFNRMKLENTRLLTDHLFSTPIGGPDVPLIRSKTFFGIADDENTTSVYNKLKENALGIRYKLDHLRSSNRKIAILRLVCKLWNNLLKDHTIRLEIAYIQENPHFSDLKSDIIGSTALRGMRALDTHRLERSVKTLIYASRKYVFVDDHGEIRLCMQNFPANLILQQSPFVKLRVSASTDQATCVHTPKIASAQCNRTSLHIRSVIDMKSALLQFKNPIRDSNAGTPLVSGMFFVNENSLIGIDWTPNASSYSFRSFTKQPLTAMRLIIQTGSTQDANETMCKSAPFYVVSRKSSQAAVDAARSKRRKNK